jgi:hypothetical protein
MRQVDAAEIGAGEQRAAEAGGDALGAADIGIAQIDAERPAGLAFHAVEPRPRVEQHAAGQPCTGEIRFGQDGIAEAGAAQIRLPEIGAVQPGIVEFRREQIGLRQIDAVDLGIVEIGPGQPRLVQVDAREIDSGEIGPRLVQPVAAAVAQPECVSLECLDQILGHEDAMTVARALRGARRLPVRTRLRLTFFIGTSRSPIMNDDHPAWGRTNA